MGLRGPGPVGRMRFAREPRGTVWRTPYLGEGLQQRFQYLMFGLIGLFRALTSRSSWIYVSDLFACPLGLLISVLFPRRKIVYHEHDFPSPVVGSTMVGRWSLASRSRLIAKATFCVVPNEERRDLLARSTHGNKVIVVWNCPRKHETRERSSLPGEGELRVLYQGSINSVRLPLSVIDALALLPDAVSLDVVGYETAGSRGYLLEMQHHADKMGLTQRLRTGISFTTREELLAFTSSHDVSLCLMPVASSDLNERAMAKASNKPFDSLARGVAVLVPDVPDWRELFVEGGYGRACDPGDPSTIASALTHFLADPVQAWEMGERGRQKVLDDWNYEERSRELIALLED